MSVFGVTDDGSLRFTETEAIEVKLTPFQWSRSCKLSDNWFARYRTKDGVSNLGDMALRSVIKNRHGLTADVLSHVDWEPVGKRIWEEIKAKKGVTVAVWKEFAIAYADRDTLYENFEVLAPAVLPLDLFPDTFSLINVPQHTFVTLVNIVNQPMDLSRWMSICGLQNLRALLVDTGRLPTLFDDRVARGWSTHALENGAFGNLYSFVLCAYNERRVITAQSMSYLHDLPHLHVMGLRGVHLPKSADVDELGWSLQRTDDPNAGLTILSTTSSLARLYAHFRSNWPYPALSDSVARLVIRVGDPGDINIFRVSYNLFSSFTIMTKDTGRLEGKRRIDEASSSSSATPQPRRPPKIRARAQKDFGDLFAHFGS